MNEGIKRCPLCGGKDIDTSFWARQDGTTGPGCMGCGATAESVTSWNSRPLDRALAERAFEAGWRAEGDIKAYAEFLKKENL